MAAVATGMGSGSRAPRWVVAALVGSLALNLVVLGAIASSLWRGSLQVPDAPVRVPRTIVGYAASTLPEARRKELQKQAQEQWRAAEVLRRELQKARAEAIAALVAEPFDEQRFLTVQSLLLAADLKSREATLKLNSTIGVNLTPEERRGYLPWRERQRPFLRNPLDTPEKQGDAPK
jgi:uncharacterized membrane protein